MKIIHFIFQEFQEKQSLIKVVEYFLKNDIFTKRGKEYSTTAIKDILTNPVYCIADEDAYEYFETLGCQLCFTREEANGTRGLISYAKTSSETYKNKDNPPEEWIIALGKHKGEIKGKDFVKVQKMIAANSTKSESYRKVKNEIALLSGILYCTCGHAMRPKYYNVKQITEEGERKFSYRCPYKDGTHGEKCNVENAPGNDLDQLVCEELFRYAEPDSRIGTMLEELKKQFENSKSDSVDELGLLNQAIKEKEESINNLIATIKKPGRSQAFIEHIDEEISKLEEECDKLRNRAALLKEGKEAVIKDVNQVDLIISELETFKRSFQTLSVPQKREYLRLLLDKVVWDGETAHIFLYGSH